jgi:hypothetical protein
MLGASVHGPSISFDGTRSSVGAVGPVALNVESSPSAAGPGAKNPLRSNAVASLRRPRRVRRVASIMSIFGGTFIGRSW